MMRPTSPPPGNDDGETAGGDDVLEKEGQPAEPDPPPDAGEPLVASDVAIADVGKTSTDAASIRADALAHARAVIDLCRLAGQPQMAGRFLERDTSLDDVRTALLATRADAVPDISAAHPQPGRPSEARPWGDVIAHTFRLKG